MVYVITVLYIGTLSRSDEKALLLEHGLDDGVSSSEETEELVGRLGVSRGVDESLALACHCGGEDAAICSLEEGIKGIGI